MTQRALKTINNCEAAVLDNTPVPEIPDAFILAQPKAYSLNPTDWKHMRYIANPGSTLGNDWSGTVLTVGKNVTMFKPGDDAFGACHGGNNRKSEAGAYAGKVVVGELATYKKPANLSFPEAATLGVGLATIGQVLYEFGGFAEPSLENLKKAPTKDVLIYGGSSATGTLAIQFAKLSGYRVLTTSSPSNFDLLRSRGADLIFDYKDPVSIDAIKSATNDKLSYIMDCIGNDTTASFCAQVLSPQGGHYHSLQMPISSKFKDLRPEDTAKATTAVAYTMLGEQFVSKDGQVLFDVPEGEAEFVRGWHETVAGLLERGLVTPHPTLVREGGIDGVLQGVYELERTGGPSGRKLVYTVA